MFISLSAFAQTTPQFVEYAAKFLCGRVTPGTPETAAVRPGVYATKINIHNPQLPLGGISESVAFLKKAVLSLPEGTPQQPPSPFRQDVLKADFAEEVDCNIIREMLGLKPNPTGPFIEGWAVLIVPPSPVGGSGELDVTGVYTVQPEPGTPAQPISLEIVPIQARFIPAQPGATLGGTTAEKPKIEGQLSPDPAKQKLVPETVTRNEK